MSLKLILQLISLVWLIVPLIVANPPSLAQPKCEAGCGNVSIPYPFGIGKGCYHDEWYAITCNHSFSSEKPFLSKLNLEMLEVLLEEQLVKLNIPIAKNCAKQDGIMSRSFKGSPFNISRRSNEFTVVGCGNALITYNGEIMAGCTSTCSSNTITTKGCYGINCCQASIPTDIDIYGINISSSKRSTNCTSAFVVDQDWFRGKFSNPYVINKMKRAPVTLTWTLTDLGKVKKGKFKDYKCDRQGPYYSCHCKWPYKGNPYVSDGCQVVEGCYALEGKYHCDMVTKREKIISKLSNFVPKHLPCA